MPNARSPHIYLIVQPGIRADGFMPNLSGATKFGRLHVLLQPGDANPWTAPEECMRLMAERLRDYNPELDYFLWAGGDTVVVTYLGVILADWGMTRMRWLKYEGGAEYSPYTLPLLDTTLLDEDTPLDDEDQIEIPIEAPRIRIPTQRRPVDGRRRSGSSS